MMLSPIYHARLLADADHVCQTAQIPKGMLQRSAKEYVTGPELEWIQNFPVHQRASRGLILVGHHTPPPDIKMMALTAALLRNYVDARIVTVNTLISAHNDKDAEIPDPTVMMIPNLFIRQGGKGLPSWQIQIVYDTLLARFTAGKPTVAYVENMDALGKEYGSLMIQHLTTNYVVSER